MKRIHRDNTVYLRLVHDDFYFEKNSVIIDKTCPKCGKFLFDTKDFCDCGYYLKGKENRFIIKIIILGFLFTLISGYFSFLGIKTLSERFYKILNISDIEKLSPINIQMFSALKNNHYYIYIQDIYLKNKEKSKLYILIKPSLWKYLNKKEKIKLLNQINTEWKKVFQRNFPESKETPTVTFANN